MEAFHTSEALLRENDSSKQTTPSPVCQFFKSGRENPMDSASWGKRPTVEGRLPGNNSEDNKQDDLDNVLIDYPLGWWDQHWLSVTLRAENLRHLKFFATPNPSCPNIDKKMGAKSYVSSIQSALALHTRYPGHKGHNPKGSAWLSPANLAGLAR
ncbi:hypothetical protein WJX77_009754 [Trebouxia sp. C0004]